MLPEHSRLQPYLTAAPWASGVPAAKAGSRTRQNQPQTRQQCHFVSWCEPVVALDHKGKRAWQRILHEGTLISGEQGSQPPSTPSTEMNLPRLRSQGCTLNRSALYYGCTEYTAEGRGSSEKAGEPRHCQKSKAIGRPGDLLIFSFAALMRHFRGNRLKVGREVGADQRRGCT